MTLERALRALAVILTLATILMFGVTLWINWRSDLGGTTDLLGFGLASTAFALVGGLIVAKRPRNLVGPTMLIGGAAWVLYDFARSYALLTEGSPGHYLAAWIGAWFGALLPVSIALLLLLFPTGKVRGRWRWLLGGLLLATVLAVAGAAAMWGLPISVLLDLGRLDRESAYAPVNTAFMLGWLLIIPALASLAWRFRRGDRIERQQVKWLLASSSVAVVALVISIPLAGSDNEVYPALLLTSAMTLMPLSILLAVLRYRLYEIDRIINRTVVYAIVVGLLVAVYVAGVVLLQSVLPERGDLAVAASTLAAAALFNPLRKRVQSFVDRRFYRSRYDAKLVVEEFSARLRDEVDLDGLTADWVGVVEETVQPSSVSVWVKEPGESVSG